MTLTESDSRNNGAQPEQPKSEFGEIIGLLIKEGYLSEDQVRYAQRVLSKLATPKSLLEVARDLKYVDEEQIMAAIRTNRVSMRIGVLLQELGLISAEDLETAFRIQSEERPKRKLGEVLIAHGFIDERRLLEILSLQLGFPFIEPEFVPIDKELFLKGPVHWYRSRNYIPIRVENRKPVVAFADPLDQEDIKSAKEVFGGDFIPAIARKTSIESAIRKMVAGADRAGAGVDETSVVGMVDSLLLAAIEENASDIHIEPLKDRMRVRFRRDGVLDTFKEFPKDVIPGITSRIKVMCEADITERRRHQGGRIFFDHPGGQIDLRVSTYVTIHGEKIVLRLLNRQGHLLEIKDLGMGSRMRARFLQDALDLPSGVIIITGPTGSGKTTTVYSCIHYLNDPHTSIITAEEPVELLIEGVAQCSINPKINLTFNETLRHMVRQDPDVIVIGEIRDNFTADVAVQAALTGHKVLTTFHTEDSIGGLIRLLNMDIESFLISSTVVSVVAQRLVRKICPECSTIYKPTPGDLTRLGWTDRDVMGATFYKGKGCTSCRHTGYSGRIAVFELLVLDEFVRNAVLDRKTSHEIRKISIETTGLVTLLEDGLVKASTGLTTIEEVIRSLPRLLQPRPYREIRRLVGEGA